MRSRYILFSVGLLVVGCHWPSGRVGAVARPLIVEAQVGPGLVHRVSVTPARLATGDTVVIASLVINRGKDTVRVSSRLCRLALGGTLQLALVDEALCRAESGSKVLAPGDSVAGPSAWRIVRSLPGRYTLRVGQLVRPDSWTDLQVQIVAPAG